MSELETIAFMQADLFTGQMHTRLADMLAVLAVFSLIMWTIVAFSIVARLIARLTVGRLHKPNQRKHNVPTA